MSPTHGENDFDRAELADLLNDLLESRATEADRARLERLLWRSAAARQYYADYMLVRASLLQGLAGGEAASPRVGEEEAWDDPSLWSGIETGPAMPWPVVRPYPLADAPPPAPAPTPLPPPPREPLKLPDRAPFWRGLAAVLIVGTLGGLLYMLTRPEEPHPVAQREPLTPATSAPAPAPATLVTASGATWDLPGNQVIQAGQRLPSGTLSLTGGVIAIRLDSGATAVIEAPAQFRIGGPNAVDLDDGRLAATAPTQAHGFAVLTTSGRVVDLGTEFGVHAAPGESTTVDVFVGKVQAEPGSGGTTTALSPHVLTAGQAAAVSADAVQLDPAGAVPQRFIRHLTNDVSSLDVVDLLTGGDGATHRRGMAINPLSGKSGPLAQIQHQQTDDRYHRVPGLPVVDGCFVPNGAAGPVVTDSAGHTFAFPATTGRSYDLIWAGGRGQHLGAPATQPALLGQTDLTKPGHGVVATHSNVGLTIDLAAVRRLYPDKTIARFRCEVGNEEPKPHNQAKTDLYVIVDGQARFERRGYTHATAPLAVDVAVRDTDRFLTLAVTDGGDQLFNDGILWGDPVLELGSR